MKNFSKFIGNMAKIVTKIVEVFQWVGAGMMLAATICALVNPDWIGYFIGFDACESCGAKLSVYGQCLHGKSVQTVSPGPAQKKYCRYSLQ